MKKFVTSVLVLGFTAALFALPANAALRSPQLAYNMAPLSAYFPTVFETFNLATDQQDVQLLSTGITGNTDFTLMMRNGANIEIGLYNPSNPSNVVQVFPAAATAGWSAYVHFDNNGSTVISLYDDHGVIQGQTLVLSLDKNSFGFAITSPAGTFYTQDGLNVQPMVVTYASTYTLGDWWLCFQAVPVGVSASTYSDAAVIVESVRVTPAQWSTFGRIKSLYR